MATKKEYAERVALLALILKRIGTTPQSDYRYYHTAVELCVVSDRLKSASVRLCNGDMEMPAYERRMTNAEKKLNSLMADVGVIAAEFPNGKLFDVGGDPRGYVVKLQHPTVASNSMGGDGYGI